MKLAPLLLCLFLLGCGCSRSGDTTLESQSASNLVSLLNHDLSILDGEIRGAEDDIIEFERLNQIHLVTARATAELQNLEFIVGERNRLEQELLLLEAQFPTLADTNTLSVVALDYTQRQRHVELKRTINALDDAERTWRHAFVLASTRESELKHLQDRLRRLNETYVQLAQRQHDLRMKEQLKSLQNQRSDPQP